MPLEQMNCKGLDRIENMVYSVGSRVIRAWAKRSRLSFRREMLHQMGGAVIPFWRNATLR
jgi:hypothetical protein